MKRLQERDKKKAEICKRHGILLIPVDYTKPLTKRHIREKLAHRDISSL